MPACSLSNVNVCGEYFLQALLPYLRVHERFRWGQLNQLARSMVYTHLYEEKAMVESLRLSLGHLDADPQNLMHTVPPECGTDDTSRLWWLGQKLTNWHMYGARFYHLAIKRAARARAFEVQRLKSLHKYEKPCFSAGTGSSKKVVHNKASEYSRFSSDNSPLMRDDIDKRSHETDGDVGDPVLNDLAMRFTYYDTLKCRRKWDPLDRSLAPCTSRMDLDFNTLSDRILPLYDDHVCLNLTVIPVLRQQASHVVSPSSTDRTCLNAPLGSFAYESIELHAKKDENPTKCQIVDEGLPRSNKKHSTVLHAVRGTSSPSAPYPALKVHTEEKPHLTHTAAKENYPPSSCPPIVLKKDELDSNIHSPKRSGHMAPMAPLARPLTLGQPYIRCVLRGNDPVSSTTRLGHTFKQLGEYLNHKNFYHDDIFVPFVLKALLNSPNWAHELVRKGYPMEVLFWAWSICSDATLFNGVAQLPTPVRYRFPDHPSSLLVSTPKSPSPSSPASSSPGSRRSRARHAAACPDHYAYHHNKNQQHRNRFQFHFQYKSSLGTFEPSQLPATHRKPWDFHPWNIASICNYICPEDEHQLRMNRKLCVQAHSYLCCSLLFDIQSRIHRLTGANRSFRHGEFIAPPTAPSTHDGPRNQQVSNMDLVISCFWDPTALMKIKPPKSSSWRDGP